GVVRRRLDLDAAELGVLDLLQEDDVRPVAADLGDRRLEVDRGIVRRLCVPGHAELHVELENPEHVIGHQRPAGIGMPAASFATSCYSWLRKRIAATLNS